MIKKIEETVGKTVLTTEDSVYTTTKFKLGKTIWSVTVVKGKFNYITVRKPSPWMTMGKQFDTMDDAVSHYKNPTMKVELLKIEMELS